ncbi:MULTISPECIES: galactokinase family protein [unclassified Pseudodesulfovibrio]|uniref:galactokinase n=1 Tax=unclassified Pseudodesulfovibrio TaxID=2661612 RepID=UPI000FEBED7A|nr:MULTISPECIES: galactokinase family protein [unclassified Pseudodesulfovibrio]MCJ2164410.1 galactokinase [Pseudodesulfovibrio sp. S3-i]RWU04616.1 galactokinase [Pseudodesulfovibrio sp. S3]
MPTAETYLQALDRGGLDSTLTELYGTASLPVQRQRYHDLLRRMGEWHQGSPVILVNVPGRTELGGNHTDHNHGMVLAAGVHFDCLAVAASTGGTLIRVRSEGFSEVIEVDFEDLMPRPEEDGTAQALVRGVAAGFRSRGWPVGGFDACIASSVPIGAGLSSSAAFEVCVGQIFNHLFNRGERTSLDLAIVSREAENVFFGKPCGLMDQLACATQGILSIDFKDPSAPVVTELPFDFDLTEYQLTVVDTGGSHADLTPEYAAIPNEMGLAAKALGQEKARGLTIRQVLEQVGRVREAAGDRGVLRLIHFIEENDRAQKQAVALRAGDMPYFLRLVREAGDSSWRLLQNCISTANYLEQPIPLALALTDKFLSGNGACRVQGGGFAGTIQAYVPKVRFGEYGRFMETVFGPGSVMPLKIRRPGFDCIRLGKGVSG